MRLSLNPLQSLCRRVRPHRSGPVLPLQDPPRLPRPVLLVHGYNSGPGAWQGLQTWLTRGQVNQDGGVVQAETAQIDPRGRVFSMQFSRPFNPSRINSAELRQAIEHISAATGSPSVDVIAHSKGGMDARLYLDQGEEKIEKLVMVGTPNHGSKLADLDLALRRRGIALTPRSRDPLIAQALSDCRQTGGAENPLLDDLNNHWSRQRERADILCISGQGRPTLSGRFGFTLNGDGAVAQDSLAMPGVPMRIIPSAGHGGIREHPLTMQQAVTFLLAPSEGPGGLVDQLA